MKNSFVTNRLQHDDVITLIPGDKRGIKIKRDSYCLIKAEILKLLTEHGVISYNRLIESMHQRFALQYGDKAGWYIYNIKLDLEARKLIVHDRNEKLISLAPSHTAITETDKQETMSEASYTTIPGSVTTSVKEKFRLLFDTEPLIVNSPGRINLIGEHTDYNAGYVMPAAIDMGIQMAFGKSGGNQSILYSLKYNEYFAVDDNVPVKVEAPFWANYFLGILSQLQSRGYKVKQFNCVFHGDIPTGAGLSSSAAMECAFVFGLNELFKLGLSKIDMVHIAQWAEHNYVGVQCGIMDQFASMMGRAHHAIQLDCRNLNYSYFPLELQDYSLLLCDTNIKHALASSEYNTRRKECETGVQILKSRFNTIESLRDVSKEMLRECKDLIPDNIFKRCLYVVEENERVLNGGKDLKDGKLEAFGQKMFDTHWGLSRMYEVSCPELDFLVAYAQAYPGILGSRMMGGGFGGCTLNIIESTQIGDFVTSAKSNYKEKFGIEMKSYVVKIGNGTALAR